MDPIVVEKGEHAPGQKDSSRASARTAAYANILGDSTGALILLLVAVTVINVIERRFVNHTGFLWVNSASGLAIDAIGFFGAVYCLALGRQPRIAAWPNRAATRLRAVEREVTRYVISVAIGALAYSAYLAAKSQWPGTLPYLNVSYGIPPLLLGIACALSIPILISYANPGRLGASALESSGALWLRCLVSVGGVSSGVVVAGSLIRFNLQPAAGVWTALILMAALLLIGIPVVFCLAMVGIAYGALTGLDSVVLPQQMLSGLSSYTLVAIPCFIFAGLLLAQSDAGREVTHLIARVLRRAPGGPIQSVIACMYVFSGMSGSKAADIAAVGTSLRNVATDSKVASGEYAALLAAAAIMGETIPPSLVMLTLASVSPVSTLALFAAGIIPALLLALGLAGVVAYRRRGHDASIEPARRIRLNRAIPAALIPLVLVVGILWGVGTPTEVSALADVAALLIVFWCSDRHEFFGAVLRALRGTSALSGMVIFLVAAAQLLSWTITYASFPQRIADALTHAGGGRYGFLFLTAGVLLVAGLFLEGIPAVIIFGPLLIPVAETAGVNAVQFSIILIIALGIGAFLPPLGAGAYVAAGVADTDVNAMIRPMSSYVSGLLAMLVVIILVPAISTGLPSWLGLGT